MRQLILGLALGTVIGLTCTGCSLAKAFISAEPMQVILTERGHIQTTKVKTGEGIYRIFTIENTNGNGGVGISAVRVE